MAGSSSPVSHPVQLFKETTDPPWRLLACFSLCNSTPLPSRGSAIGHTAQHPVETPTPLEPDWRGYLSVIVTQEAHPLVFSTWFLWLLRSRGGLLTADISPHCFTAINRSFHSCSHYKLTNQHPGQVPLGNTLNVYTYR